MVQSPKLGLRVSSGQAADGTVYLDYLGWDGAPNHDFKTARIMLNQHALAACPSTKCGADAWVNGVDEYNPRFPRSIPGGSELRDRFADARGSLDWTDYEVSSDDYPTYGDIVRNWRTGSRVCAVITV